MDVLKVGDTGSYLELRGKANPAGLVVSYDPPIEALLERARQLKEAELTEAETLAIRNAAPAIALPKEVHQATFGSMNC
ncbi:MAG: hypothetical protein H7A09_03270 [Oceanospirillaceae bacterium]|nr:hypothetical protein [Oceanospirillaceae bacterium]MCP5335637.1 hypothetical protein [Oceanospirillaceae bacterium]